MAQVFNGIGDGSEVGEAEYLPYVVVFVDAIVVEFLLSLQPSLASAMAAITATTTGPATPPAS
jgi:hypothetical protein